MAKINLDADWNARINKAISGNGKKGNEKKNRPTTKIVKKEKK